MSLQRIKLNLKQIWKCSCLIGSAVAFVCGAFLSWDILKIFHIPVTGNTFEAYVVRAIVLFIIGLAILSISTIYVLYRVKNNSVWKHGTGELFLEYGDLFRIASDSSFPHIVAIPVNNTFDTIVDKNPCEQECPLVSPKTNHGRWIDLMQRFGWDLEYIDRKIERALSGIPYRPIPIGIKRRGKRKNYSVGTVAFLSGPRNIYYSLLALSIFDDNNNAQSSAENLKNAVACLVDHYDKNGQGYDLYIPIMGVGLSRSNLSKKEALDIIKCTLLANQWKIHGKVHIVIYEKEKDELSIFS